MTSLSSSYVALPTLCHSKTVVTSAQAWPFMFWLWLTGTRCLRQFGLTTFSHEEWEGMVMVRVTTSGSANLKIRLDMVWYSPVSIQQRRLHWSHNRIYALIKLHLIKCAVMLLYIRANKNKMFCLVSSYLKCK